MTVTISGLAACAVLVLVAGVGLGIDPPPGGQGPALLAVLVGSLCFAACGHVAADIADAFPLAHLTSALQHAWLPTGTTIAWGDLGVMALWGPVRRTWPRGASAGCRTAN